MIYTYECPSCHFSEGRTIGEKSNACPQCTKPKEPLKIRIEDKIKIGEEFDLIGRDPKDLVTGERIRRSDGNTSASAAMDAGGPLRVSTERETKVSGFEEEGIVADVFAKSFNNRNGTDYTIESKATEDSDYADRVLISASATLQRIQIQIRHLDDEARADLGKNEAFSGRRTGEDLRTKISNAIQKKSLIDAKTKANAILLLQVLYPLTRLARDELQMTYFDLKGFRDVWIAPFREDSFPIFPALPAEQIALRAYSLWSLRGRPHGDDLADWYAAIRELRSVAKP
jgi:Protein of unknown function (DUF2934)